MDGTNPGWATAAFAGTSVYFTSFVLFQIAARRMPPLRGSRPVHATLSMVGDPVWFTGGLLLFIGLAYQVIAFASLPMNTTQPLLGLSLLLLLGYTTVFLHERLSPREWAVAALSTLAVVVLGLSGSSDVPELHTGDAWTLPPLILVVAPPALVAGLVWLVGDRRAGGRHAQPLAGVAYGISAGMCAGVAEAGARGIAAVWSDRESVLAVAASPYPYLVLGMAGITLIQLQIALQRCRLGIVAIIIAVTGRAVLVVSSTVLYDEPWPAEAGPLALRWGGFALVLLAVTAFPRHERPPLGAVSRALAGRRRSRRAGPRPAAVALTRARRGNP